MVDLELIETPVLLEELLNRFDHAAFVGMKAELNGPEEHEYSRSWLGNTHCVVGLLSDLQTRVIDRLRENEFEK